MTGNNEMIIDRLIIEIDKKNNPSTIGLDTVASYMPQNYFEKCTTIEDTCKYITQFNKKIIDSIFDVVPSVKIQIACYEMYGIHGLTAFYETVKYAKQKGLVVISDIKRNDIGSTAKCYSNAYLGETELYNKNVKAPFDTDFVTINGYLGFDGIEPFAKDCKDFNKGLFILVKTSNPSSGELQDRVFSDGRTLYETMGDYVMQWGKPLIGKYGYSSIGAVVGATYKEQAQTLRKNLKSVFFLIPGYGAQGGKAQDLAVCFDENKRGGIVNSSRAILTAYKSEKYKGLDYCKAARQAVLDMKEDLNNAIGNR